MKNKILSIMSLEGLPVISKYIMSSIESPFPPRIPLISSTHSFVSDVMNDAMSLGIHRLWKDYFVSRLNPPMISDSFKVLDVAGGTGDIAFRILQYHGNNIKARSNLHVSVVDINPSMLGVGQSKAEGLIKSGAFNSSQISFLEANAEKLIIIHGGGDNKNSDVACESSSSSSTTTTTLNSGQIAENSFDAYTIAFGIRNCTDIKAVLDQAYRVLKPGGRFLCLEFSHVEGNPIISALYDAYSFGVIPTLGQFIANDAQSYQYLVESIRKFPKQQEFAQLICDAGFNHVSYENLSQGIVSIHSGFKI